MAAQERIIGGGFLFIGVAIVLVLLYFFTWGGTSSKEAYETILDEIFPTYLAAEKEGDYLKVKDAAQAILDKMEEGGAATVRKHIAAEATSGRRASQRLGKLLKARTFEKNAEGRYGYKGGWYGERTHRALGQLAEAVDKRMRVLRSIRETAISARKALEDARVGSRKPLPLPPAKGKAADDAPIVTPNPVYENDEELYRVFGLSAEVLQAALATADPGGRATSARLRWNGKIATSDLGKDIAAIPERADELHSIANQIDVNATTLAADASAADVLKDLLTRGVELLGAEMSAPHRTALRENAAAFARGSALVNVLRNEARMLAPYLSTVRALGGTFPNKFK